MIIQFTKSGETFSLKRHKKLPTFATTGKEKAIKLDGKAQRFIMHPTKADSPRVSLIIGNTRYYRDDPQFKKWVQGLKAPANIFTTVQRLKGESRPAKPAAKPAAKPRRGATAPSRPRATASAPARTCSIAGCKAPAIYSTSKGKPRCQDHPETATN